MATFGIDFTVIREMSTKAIKGAVFAAIFVTLTWSLIAFDAFERLHQATRQHEDWELDEIIVIGFMTLIIGIAWLAVEAFQRGSQIKAEKKALEAAEELFGKAFNSSPVLFSISMPKDGRHIDVNEAWSSLTGYTRDEALRKTVLELGLWANPEDREKFIERVEGLDPIRNFETVFRTKHGVEKAMLLSGEFIDFQGENCLLVAGQDITERMEFERMKNEFISIASHELRTPLTSLKGALSLIHSDMVGQVPKAIKPFLEIAHRNSERLGLLIDDILNMEKLDVGKMEFSMQPVPLPALIRQAISEHEGFAIEYGVSFLVDGDVPNVGVLGDEDRLMQVFSNLMSNAAKFSPKGSVVRLSAHEKGEDVRISITDEGPGIPKEFHDKIFEKFGRAGNSDFRQQNGTGLGLSIAKAVIEKHGGVLGLETRTDAGTTFYFDLPKADHEPNP